MDQTDLHASLPKNGPLPVFSRDVNAMHVLHVLRYVLHALTCCTQVTDAAGNDITDAKPTYKVQEGAWGAPEDDEPDYDPTEWVDKSVTGFGKADTSWLTEEVPELAVEMDERAKKRAEEDVSLSR